MTTAADIYGVSTPGKKTSPKVRVLVNALSARLGGGQTYVTNLLRFLPEEGGVETFVLAPDSLAIPADRENIKRISVKWPVENPFARAAWEQMQLPRLVRQFGVDVLFCPGGIIGSSNPLDCKSITTFQNMIPFSPIQRRRYRLGYMRARNRILNNVMLRSMLRADLVICLSDYAREVLQNVTQGGLKNTVTIPHGVSPAFRKPATGSPPRPVGLPREGYLLYVSTIDYYKAQIEVIQAYAILRRRRDTKEKLVLVGPEYPEYGRAVRREIGRLDLEKDVLIAGIIPHANMPAVYQNAVLNIYASECENCPSILLEALAAGRPLVVSNRPPMPEFAGDAAVYFDPQSPNELADVLASVLDDPAAIADLSAKAEKRAFLYDWKSTSAATWKAIEQCR